MFGRGDVEGVPGRDGVPGGGSDDEAFDGPPDGVPGRIAEEAFETDIDDESFGLLDGEPARIDRELVSAPGRMPDESFGDGVPCLSADDAFDMLDGVTGRGGAARGAGFSVVWPAQVSSTAGGGGNAGALSRRSLVDVMSGTPSLRGDSRRGDDTSCDANGAVTSGSPVGGADTRVADESNWFVADPSKASTRVLDESNWFVEEPSSTRVAEESNWLLAEPSNWSTRVADESNGSRAASGIGGGSVEPFARAAGAGVVRGGVVPPGRCGCAVGARCGSVMPVGCPLLPARRGGNGGKRRPHDWHAAISSAFSALQNGQNRI